MNGTRSGRTGLGPGVVTWALAALAAVVWGAGEGAAQEPADVRFDRAGTLLRVTAAAGGGERREGRFEALTDAVLTLRLDDGATWEVPRDEIGQLEFSTGRRGHPWWGAVVGAFVGGIPAAVWWSRECEGPSSCRHPGLEGFAFGALYGAPPGFLVGWLIRTRAWRVLPLVYLDSAGGRGGVGPRPEWRVGPGLGGSTAVGVRIPLGGGGPAPVP